MSEVKIVRLITRLNIGGPARQALLLTREMTDSPTVLAAGTPAPEEGELSDPLVPVHRIPLVRPFQPRRDAAALAAIRSLIRINRPHLVHTHMAKAGSLGRLAAMTVRPRPKLVHTFHGHVLEGYFSPKVQRAFVEIERRLARRTDMLVAVSPQVRDSLLSLGIGSPDRFKVIPLGFDLHHLLQVEGPRGAFRAATGIPPGVPLVGIIGRLAPIKDHLTLLEAMARVPEAHLAIVGDGELRTRLEGEVERLRLAPRVHFAGWWTDMSEVLADLEVVALTSRNEGTPVSLIEALAAGRPVVATDVGGVRFVVDHEATGLVCPPGSPEAVGEALLRLLEDEDMRKRMGAEGRSRVSGRFSHLRLLRDIRALYAELLAN